MLEWAISMFIEDEHLINRLYHQLNLYTMYTLRIYFFSLTERRVFAYGCADGLKV